MTPRLNLPALRDRLTIATVLRAHGLEPKHGRMPCPLHRGENPQAFSIASSGKFARCWACEFAGDGISLQQQLTGADFLTAASACAAMVGIGPAPKLHRETLRRLQAEREAAALRAEQQHNADRALFDDLAKRQVAIEHDMDALGATMKRARREGWTDIEDDAWTLLGELTMRRDVVDEAVDQWRVWMSR